MAEKIIEVLINNGLQYRHRSLFFIVGDKAVDQIMSLITKANVEKSEHEALWCYKDESQPNSLKRKREPEKVDPLSSFVQAARIKFCSYRDSERILLPGNTFSMCILQDFEALTPNLLATTIETVEGGGLVIFLLPSVPSLTSLYTMAMDVHQRFCTESRSEVKGRFNERFFLSLASCEACIVMDDELNILPISSRMKSIDPAPAVVAPSESEVQLNILKEAPDTPLIGKCRTLGQANAVKVLLQAVSKSRLPGRVTLTGSRGRGKSAALGLAVAGAVDAGFPNIIVTAPSPKNLKTLFEFVSKGLDVLGYTEDQHYRVVKSTEPGYEEATVKINISKGNRATIEYIQPHEHGKSLNADVLVIDEAAALPLPIVKSLLGPHIVLLSVTEVGYEGTGTSLSLKLHDELDAQGVLSPDRFNEDSHLIESIRYASADPIESWLNSLLCLDVADCPYLINHGVYPLSECSLYYVNRETLFSYKEENELFLKRMMTVYVASHKNSQDDLLLLADAPEHHLFVLTGHGNKSKNHHPDVLCVIQICFEGPISGQPVKKSFTDGSQSFTDQIPRKFRECFPGSDFTRLVGARIVRIATHPSVMGVLGGSSILRIRYYRNSGRTQVPVSEEAAEKASLLEENIEPKTNLPPLLVPLHVARPRKLDYLAVSFELTLDLFCFWKKHDFVPFYIGNVPITGEFTCMALKPLNNDGPDHQLAFSSPLYQGFRKNFAFGFTKRLQRAFCGMGCKLAMSILGGKLKMDQTLLTPKVSLDSISDLLPFKMKHLEAYSKGLAVGREHIDLVATDLASAYFLGKIPVTLLEDEASVLLCIGLQHKDETSIMGEMNWERLKLQSLYKDAIKQFYDYLCEI